MKPTPQDQRVYSRIPSNFTVMATQLEYPFTEAQEVAASARDIAEGGISFVSPYSYAPQSLVSLKIEMKGWQRHAKGVRVIVDDAAAKAPLTAVAEVVWSKPLSEGEGYEVGVKFINIDKDDLKAFHKYLEQIRAAEK